MDQRMETGLGSGRVLGFRDVRSFVNLFDQVLGVQIEFSYPYFATLRMPRRETPIGSARFDRHPRFLSSRWLTTCRARLTTRRKMQVAFDLMLAS
jgi:hypothetical protein